MQEKLDNIEATGDNIVVASCAPCILQLRGGIDKRKSNIKVVHIAGLLAELKSRINTV
jgi:Fe-S oxidoreductase